MIRAQAFLGLGLECFSIRSQHREISGGTDTGFGVRIKSVHTRELDIGITGDTRYYPGLETAFDSVQILVAHIGRLSHPVTHGFADNHLSFPGIVTLVSRLSNTPELVIVAEFGEEMNGKRVETCEMLERHILNQGRRVRCIPADQNMRVMIGGMLRVGKGLAIHPIANLRVSELEEAQDIFYDW